MSTSQPIPPIRHGSGGVITEQIDQLPGTTKPLGVDSSGKLVLLDQYDDTALQAAIALKADAAELSAHASNTGNPHGVTKSQVGLGNVPNVDATLRSNHSGTQSLDTTTDTATRLAMSAAERTKLAGIANAATANATDAQLRDRSTHTGTQTRSTISDLGSIAAFSGDQNLRTTDSPTFAGGTFTGRIQVPDEIGSGSFLIGGANGPGLGGSLSGFYTTICASRTNPAMLVGLDRATLPSNYFFGFTSGNWAQPADVRLWRGAASRLEQRNGTSGQVAAWYKTFTSATNAEWVEVDSANNASNFDFAVCSGSAGGTLRGLRFGAKSAGGAFSSWLSADTSGNWILGSTQPTTLSALGRLAISANSSRAIQIEGNAGSIGVFCNFSGVSRSGANAAISVDMNAIAIPFFVGRSSGAVTLIELDGTGNLTFTPSSSRTLATNGQCTIEMTSNTAGNLVYRGSDGTTRRMALTFS